MQDTIEVYAEQTPDGIRLLTFDTDEIGESLWIRTVEMGVELPENAKLMPTGFNGIGGEWAIVKEMRRASRLTTLNDLERDGEPLYTPEEVHARAYLQARSNEAFDTCLPLLVDAPPSKIIYSRGLITKISVPKETFKKMHGLANPNPSSLSFTSKIAKWFKDGFQACRQACIPDAPDCSIPPSELEDRFSFLQNPDLNAVELRDAILEYGNTHLGGEKQYERPTWPATVAAQGDAWFTRQVTLLKELFQTLELAKQPPAETAAAPEAASTDLASSLQAATEQAMEASRNPEMTPDDPGTGVGVVVLFAGPEDATQPKPDDNTPPVSLSQRGAPASMAGGFS